MRIRTIELQNFRGVWHKKKFSLEGKPFILLTAPNGLGKTTLIDSIEWCLTGNISRLKNAFNARGTNDDERKKNVDGILKNKKASREDEILVILNIIDSDEIYTIKRVQKKDELDAKLSKVWLNGSETRAAEMLPKIADRNFYNFHFCDVQKSIEIQNRKRKNLPDLFLEFITDYTRENLVAENLDLFAEDTTRYKQDLEEIRKAAELDIKRIQDELKGYMDTPVIQDYPEIQIYSGEKVLNIDLDESMLKEQLKLLFKCGYKQADIFLTDLIRDYRTRTVLKDLIELENILKEKKDLISRAINEDLNIGSQRITELEKKIEQYKEISLTKNNIWEYLDIIIALDSSVFTKDEYTNTKKLIHQLEEESNNIKKEIEVLSKGNEVLDSLSSMLSKEVGLRKYREDILEKNEIVKCPVCGSEQFGQIEQEEILNDAREYINQHGLLLTEKKRHEDQLENKIEIQYESLIKTCNHILTDEISKNEKRKGDLVKLQEETANFFTIEKRLEQINSEEFKLEKLVEPDFVASFKNEIELYLLSVEEISQKRLEYKKILELLEYKEIETESEVSIAQKIQELAKDAPDLINFSHSLLVQKIGSINSILNNKRYLNLRSELQKENTKIVDIKKQQCELNILFNKAKQHAEHIRNLVNQLKSDEYNKVGPNLFKFYKKLSRINAINSIQLKQETGLLSIVDESDKNIVNILSNGQLSVFMLAYFFAGIVSRNKQELCKIYFIDDLTACMDDVNMLAFLDLMKYQLLARDGVVDQMFFASCDDRICKLLRYKLNGCSMDFCELREKDFT